MRNIEDSNAVFWAGLALGLVFFAIIAWAIIRTVLYFTGGCR